MKTFYLSFLAFIAINASAQWTFDPANPQLVCDENNYQNAQQSQPDGLGGAYIFWMDSRVDFYKREVYGQHVNSEGELLWEPEGRLILTDFRNIEFFRFNRYSDGKMIIGWYPAEGGVANPQDKLYYQELNEEGQKVWAVDLAVSEESPDGALSVGTFTNSIIKRDAMGFQVCMMINTYGYDRIRMSRFSEDGQLLMPLNGVEIGPLDIGNVSMTGDGGTGAYVYYSVSNGAGAQLMCMRVDFEGGFLWNDWVSVADANGLSYQFSAIGDDAGVTLVWQGNGVNVEDLYARRLNADGSFAWNGESVNVCTAAGSQSSFHWTKFNDEYYITWADGRPGIVGYYAIYAQKFTIDGDLIWAQDGVQVADLNTYAPTPRIIRGTDDFLYVTHISTVAGYVIQKLNQDGEVQWDADGEQIAVSAFAANGNERSEFVSNNNLLAIWVVPIQSGGSDKIYINRIQDLTPVTIVQESVTACDQYTYEDVVYDESGLYEIEIGADSLLQLQLTLNESTSSTLTETSCGAFALNDESYDESGVYVQVIPNFAGCDSTITLNLTVVEVNNTLTNDGVTITAQQENASYQWVDCATGQGVGDNTQSFTPLVSGLYQVNVTVGDCSALSDCVAIDVIGIEESNVLDGSVYPNPFTDKLWLKGFENQQLLGLTVTDMTGRVVWSRTSFSAVEPIDLSFLSSGHYNIAVETAHGKVTRMVHKSE